MRHSCLTQSYQYTPPTLEVTEAEILNRVPSTGWMCHTIEQMNIPKLQSALAKYPRRERSEKVLKVRRSRLTHSGNVIVRMSSSTSNLHEIHQANICRSLERRIRAAQERGDERLLCTLMAEMREVVCAIAV
jgi:hypothetical protein